MNPNAISRRSFLTRGAVAGAAFASLTAPFAILGDDVQSKPQIQGFDDTETNVDPNAGVEILKGQRAHLSGKTFCKFTTRFHS